jgi:hypothetical protein
MQETPYSFGLGVNVGEAGLDVLDPERHQASAHHLEAVPMVLRLSADDQHRSVGATFQLAAKFGVGRSGGMPNAIVIALTSEARRARLHIRSW